MGFAPPTRRISAALDRAEQLRLQGGIEIADLVDEERAAVGLLEEPLARCRRPRERAALVSEELGLDQARRHRRAIEDDEGTARARPRLVERLRERLLPRAGLPLDDDRDLARGEALAQRIEAQHRGASTDDARERRRPERRVGRTRICEALDADGGRADAQELAAAREGVDDVVVVDPRAVRRSRDR